MECDPGGGEGELDHGAGPGARPHVRGAAGGEGRAGPTVEHHERSHRRHRPRY